MPIFSFDVNVAFCEKLVPIIRQMITSIGPSVEEIMLKLIKRFPSMGPYGYLRLKIVYSLRAASEDALSAKIVASFFTGKRVLREISEVSTRTLINLRVHLLVDLIRLLIRDTSFKMAQRNPYQHVLL